MIRIIKGKVILTLCLHLTGHKKYKSDKIKLVTPVEFVSETAGDPAVFHNLEFIEMFMNLK